MINNYLLYNLFISTTLSFVLVLIVRYKLIKQNHSYWVDLLFVIGSLVVVLFFKGHKGWFALILFWGLFLLSLLDALYRILPDILTGGLLIVGLILSVTGQFISVEEAILGVLIGYGILWSISYAYKYFYGRMGIGAGDLKLASALGAWVGFYEVPRLLFLSSVFACWFYFVMVYCGKYARDSKIPFGIFLSITGMGIFTLRFSSWYLLLG